MERNYAIDFIKFFAILAVVIIHSYPYDSQDGFLLNTLSRFAVPFFFAASGYLFGQKIINSSESEVYFKKYTLKILKMYVCWLAFYILYDMSLIVLFNITSENLIQQLINYITVFTPMKLVFYGTGSSGYQLWYLPALIWSSIILFVFYYFKKLKILFFLCVLLHIVGLLGHSYSSFHDFSLKIEGPLFFGLFYTCLGFFFALNYKYIKRFSQGKVYLYLVFFFSLLQVIERLILREFSESDTVGVYYVSTIFLTIFLFLFVLNNRQLGKGSIFVKIGANSLGIYVIHVFIINTFILIKSFFDIENTSDTIFFKLTYTLCIFVASYFVYRFFQYIKHILRKKQKIGRVMSNHTHS